MNKLLVAKKILEEEVNKESLVDIIEIRNNNVIIQRERITEIKGILDELDNRINAINSLLEEIRDEFNDSNYAGPREYYYHSP
ncbi:hypothetical protein VMUT_1805 [Vulcanisaeta moutnovskia 768-28]|uniref:Uncharacterized protein n=1 Tax=Vulcanisaeta moutnovskia (strain 768-28) TaxID=985053 RepID=F0QVA4_VULM7|nr:hypothetical protein [Vulcanisaeta moutnovskia]ADY02006.1 hypothetical protein VMUT_1805 [Vulcanisaeta moutnovskia 768-28]